jgi:four helix bundle protein
VYGSFLNYKTGFMDSEEMKTRTKQFAINIGVLTQGLPISQINRAYSNQIIRSSSSVGANYRASRRAKSNADFINKLKIVEEELDESYFLWNCWHFSTNLKKKRLVFYIEKVKLF